MKVVNIKRVGYQDKLARHKHRYFIFKIILWAVIIVVFLSGLLYFVFFSKIFNINNIQINGLKTLDKQVVLNEFNNYLSQKYFGVKFNDNILFAKFSSIKEDLLKQYPILKDIEIDKDFFHLLILTFIEREPIGIWCYRDNCRLFDSDMYMWGQAAKSSGFLFITVDDRREGDDDQVINDELINTVKIMSGEDYKSLNIKNIVIPKGSMGDIEVYADDNSYPILFSIESKIKDQLDVLKIFLKNKTGDATFNPAYLDLRIDGRVYYK